MKKIKFFVIVVLGMVMAAAFFTSCEQEEIIVDEVVLESNVLEEGSDETVTVSVSENGTSGTALSYESWIRVYRKTNVASTDVDGEIIKVELNNVIESDAVSRTRAVSRAEESTYEISYEALGEPVVRDNYVSVQDSVLVFTRFVKDVTIVHNLMYQVAVYDDGKTREVMPYYRYENVKDCGVEIVSERKDFDGVAYDVTSYTSTISAEFNGETYFSVKNVEQRVPVVDRLVSSTVVDEDYDVLDQGGLGVEGTSVSWIEVEQVWSESGTKKFKVEVILNNSSSATHNIYSQEAGQKYYATFQIDRKLSKSDPELLGERTENSVEISKYKQSYVATYSDVNIERKFFDVQAELIYEVPVYKDELLVYEMPHILYKEPSQMFVFSGSEWQENDGVWSHPVSIGIRTGFGNEISSNGDGWEYVHQTEFLYRP